MVRTSVLNDALNVCDLVCSYDDMWADVFQAMNNAEKTGKRQVLIHPSSKVIVKFLSVMQKHGMFWTHFLPITTPFPGQREKTTSTAIGMITRQRPQNTSPTALAL